MLKRNLKKPNDVWAEKYSEKVDELTKAVLQKYNDGYYFNPFGSPLNEEDAYMVVTKAIEKKYSKVNNRTNLSTYINWAVKDHLNASRKLKRGGVETTVYGTSSKKTNVSRQIIKAAVEVVMTESVEMCQESKSKGFFTDSEDMLEYYNLLRSCLKPFFESKFQKGNWFRDRKTDSLKGLIEIFIFYHLKDHSIKKSRELDISIERLAVRYDVPSQFIRNNFCSVIKEEHGSWHRDFLKKSIFDQFKKWCVDNAKIEEVIAFKKYALEKF